MYCLNKIVWFFLNPVAAPLAGAIVGAILLGRGKGAFSRRFGGALIALSLAVLWFGSTLACVCLLGLPLERPYLATQAVGSLPQADAIVVLGGGIGKAEEMAYPDMTEGADRIWHGARLWKAGKAPVIVLSGTNDLASTVPLLLDFGVARDAIIVDNASRNTYENSRFVERMLIGGARDPGEGGADRRPTTILLVTSAWHMPRACGNFAKTSLAVVPAACDFAASNARHGARHFWDWFAPNADALARTGFLFKEWLGKLARK